MVGLNTGVGGGGGYTYVQDAQPSNPSEGEEWYDTGSNAGYVYDGANWITEGLGSNPYNQMEVGSKYWSSGGLNSGSAAKLKLSYSGSIPITEVNTDSEFGTDYDVTDVWYYDIRGNRQTVVSGISETIGKTYSLAEQTLVSAIEFRVKNNLSTNQSAKYALFETGDRSGVGKHSHV